MLDRGTVALPPVDATLTGLLDAVRGLDAAGRAAWRAAVDEGRAEHRPWAAAMHEASWAGHVSGRTRTLAIGQLHAVQAFLDGGFDLHDGASGSGTPSRDACRAPLSATCCPRPRCRCCWRRGSGSAAVADRIVT